MTDYMNNPSTPVFLHGYSGDGASLEEFAATCFPQSRPVCIDLPGFGATPLTSKRAETDPLEYVNETWHAVRRAVPEGKIHLIGHSYGGVIAFALAANHPDVVSRVDLYTPGVFPKFPSRIGLFFVKVFDLIPGGLRLFTWVLKQSLFVDAVTKSMEFSGWDEDAKRRIYAMRRKESLSYSPQMFRLSLHALSMPPTLDTLRCQVPLRVVQAEDDTVAAPKSIEWIKQRADDISIVTTYGGHLGIVAEPARLARLLYSDN